MRKLVCAIAMIFLTLCVSAQSQQGYVKTKGRLGKDGKIIAGNRISGAAIQVKGRTAVISRDNGEFSFPIPSQKFYLLNVSKHGYVLTDPDVLTRMYEYSGNEIIIVMETPEDQLQEQIEAGYRIRATLTEQLMQKEQELTRLKEENLISEKKYLELRRDLLLAQQSNEKLINEMVEEYSKIDYDQLDEFSQRVSESILNGELTKADSLLKSKGSIEDRIKRYNQHQEANRKEHEEIRKRSSALETSEYHAKKEKEDIAQDCYFFYTKCRMLHQIDSAGYYLEQRASLDTLNFDYVWRCGSFYLNQRKYDKARYYLECLVRNESLDPVDRGMALNDMAICYTQMGMFSLGRETMYQSLKLREELARSEPEKYSVSVALASSNYAGMHSLFLGGDPATAYDYFKVGMDLYEKLVQYTHFFSVNLANVQENYAQLLKSDSLFVEAEKYMQNAYAVRSEYAERYPELYNTDKDITIGEIGKFMGQVDCDSFIATRECKMIIISAAQGNKERLAYSAKELADIYFYLGDHDKCRQYLMEGNRHFEELFENNPEKFLPDLTESYIDNSYFCLNYLNDKEAAKNLADKLLVILEENHSYQEQFSSEIALCDVQILIGRINKMEEDYAGSVNAFTNVVQIISDFAEVTPDYLKGRLLEAYRYLAMSYASMNVFSDAIKYAECAVGLLETLPQDNSTIQLLCSTCFDLALLNFNVSDFSNACSILEKSIALMENNVSLFSDSDRIQMYFYYGISLIYEMKMEDALIVLKKARSYLDNEQTNEIFNQINEIIIGLETLNSEKDEI